MIWKLLGLRLFKGELCCTPYVTDSCGSVCTKSSFRLCSSGVCFSQLSILYVAHLIPYNVAESALPGVLNYSMNPPISCAAKLSAITTVTVP